MTKEGFVVCSMMVLVNYSALGFYFNQPSKQSAETVQNKILKTGNIVLRRVNVFVV